MHETAELVTGLLAATVALSLLAAKLDLPGPVVLVVGGIVLGAIPGLPHVDLDPDLVLFVFLPPLVYSAGFLTANREMRDLAGQISLLAVGLVLVTLVAVAAIAHWVAGLPWAAAFVLGAILGPTDPVVATAITRKLGAPVRLTTLLEGEALINDGTALAAYKIALAAAVSGTFAAGSAGLRLLWVAAGGILIGVAVAWAIVKLRERVDDSRLEVAVSILTPFLAYLPAERAGASGVLAAVGAGLYVGWMSTSVVAPGTRLQSLAFWRVASFALESLLFLLLGLQFPDLLGRMEDAVPAMLLDAAAVVGVLMLVRFAWMFTVPRLSGITPRESAVLGWSGMRGAVSLAAALAIPLDLGDRDAILFLTMATILATLVLPSLTLERLVCALGLGVAEAERRQDVDARIRLTHAALARLEQVAQDDARPLPEQTLDRVRGIYEGRLDRLEGLRADGGGDDTGAARPLRRELLAAERDALDRLREDRAISPEVARGIRQDLDLEETRLAKEH